MTLAHSVLSTTAPVVRTAATSTVPPSGVREHRRGARTPLGRPVDVQLDDGRLVSAFARDISLGGMFLETPFRPGLNACVVVYVALPGIRPRRMALEGKVRWTAEEGIGLQFGPLGAHDTYAITEFEVASELAT